MPLYNTIITTTKEDFNKIGELLKSVAFDNFKLLIEMYDKYELKNKYVIIWNAKIHTIGTLNRRFKKLLSNDIENIDDKIKCKSESITDVIECFKNLFKNSEKFKILYNNIDIDEEDDVFGKCNTNNNFYLPLEEASNYILYYAEKYKIHIIPCDIEKYINYILAHMRYHNNIGVIHLYDYIPNIIKDLKYIIRKTPPAKKDFGI